VIPPPGPGQRDTIVDGVRWRSREADGTGTETVVFVHGLLASSASWKEVLASASGGRRAIARNPDTAVSSTACALAPPPRGTAST